MNTLDERREFKVNTYRKLVDELREIGKVIETLGENVIDDVETAFIIVSSLSVLPDKTITDIGSIIGEE